MKLNEMKWRKQKINIEIFVLIRWELRNQKNFYFIFNFSFPPRDRPHPASHNIPSIPIQKEVSCDIFDSRKSKYGNNKPNLYAL